MDRVLGAMVPRAVDAIDPQELLERIDVDHLVARIDVDGLIQRVDVDALIQRVDVDAVVQRVDVNALMARVDVDALMARVDVDALMGRVDLDAQLASVDVPALVARAGVDELAANAASGLAGRTMDLARAQIYRLDRALLRLVDRVLRRPRGAADPTAEAAGPFVRFFGFLIDSFVVSTIFSLAVLLVSSLVGLFTGNEFSVADDGGLRWAAGFVVWWFTYLWLSVALTGRRVGKVVLGSVVVRADGEPLSSRAAAARAVAFPFSFVLGLGFVPALVGRDRRAAHDYVAGSRVVIGERVAGVHPSGTEANRLSPSTSDR